MDRRNSAPGVLKQGPLPPRQPLSQAERIKVRIKDGVCPNYPRNCRFGEVYKFQHVEPGKPDSKHVRSVAVKGSPNNSIIEQKLDTLSEALMILAQKFSGVVPPRECIIVHDTVTPIHGSLSSTHLPVSHACVRTCISKSAGASQSVTCETCYSRYSIYPVVSAVCHQ